DQTKSSWFNRRDFAPGSLSILFLTLMAAFLIGFGAGITIPFLPRFFFDVYEVDLADLSLIFALLTIITAIWGKINANLADKYGRVELIVINQMVSVTLLIVLSFYPPLAFAFLVLIIRNAVMNGVGPVNAAIQMEYTPRKYRSQINALNTLAWAFLFSIGQIIGGYLVDTYGFWLPIRLTAGFYFLATVAYWRIKSYLGSVELILTDDVLMSDIQAPLLGDQIDVKH
ncbi:MAG: MFS transporter, partial [Candidatus Heimdallarchaeota archaeon]|nr:MFS transporter [Candidatus Heimdallarchaeota archaeon]